MLEVKKIKFKILYVSYDGLNDQLGHSQIIPYIKIINLKNTVHVLSFEKINIKNYLDEHLNELNINWTKLKFTKKSFFLIKVIDFFKLIFYPLYISIFYKVDAIHCRGHLPALSGLLCKYLLNKKFIFDCRGLWADERIDNGSWNTNKLFFKIIYSFFKKLELVFFKKSDFTIVLTENIKNHLTNTNVINSNNTYIIPCCADYSKFNIVNNSHLVEFKKKLNFTDNQIVIGYFGSINQIYMPNEMLSYFSFFKKKYPNAKFILISKDFTYFTNNYNKILDLYKHDIFFISPKQSDLVLYYNICNLTLCFVKNSFARKASSPTKIAESLACGTPVVYNEDVGDNKLLLSKIYKNGGISSFDDSDLEKSVVNFNFDSLTPDEIRNNSKEYYDLSLAKIKLDMIYDCI